MLAVETVLDVALWVQLIQNPVCVVLHCRCEDYHLVYLSHLLNELLCARPDEEVTALTAHLEVVDQCFVQVKNQGVSLVLLSLSQ